MKREVCRRKYANAVLVVARTKRTPDGQVTTELSFLTIASFCANVERVVDRTDLAVDCGWQVARNEMRERQLLHAFGNLESFGVVTEEVPLVEIADLAGALSAAVRHRLFGRYGGLQEHDDALHNNITGQRSDL